MTNTKSRFWLYTTIVVVILAAFYGYSYFDKQDDLTGKLIHGTEHELKMMEREFYKSNIENLEDKDFVQKKIALLDTMDSHVRHDVYNVARADQNTYDFERVRKYYKERNDKTMLELTKILDYYTWPTISQFGEETEKQAWHLVYNAYHNPQIQSRALGVYAPLKDMNEVDLDAYYHLYDRVALNMEDMGVKQKYGTQTTMEDGKEKLLPYYGSLDDLNQRRKNVGYDVISEIEQPTEQLQPGQALPGLASPVTEASEQVVVPAESPATAPTQN